METQNNLPVDTTVETAPKNKNRTQRNLIFKFLAVREVFMFFLVIATGIILTTLSPYFFTYANLQSVFIALVPNAIIAIGMTILLVSGAFDLSVGGVMALGGTLVGLFLIKGFGILGSVLLVLTIGLAIGTANGLSVTKLKINPLIATFGMLSITRSISLIITEGYSIFGLPKAFDVMGTVKILGFPLMVWFAVVLVIVSDILLRKMRYLRQVFYIGGNENAAVLSGIKANKVRIVTYVISAMGATTAGIILASRLMAGTPTAGSGIELAVIAAAVIGGASMSGGEGTIMGAFLGVLFLALISNALVIMSASIYWHGVVNGLILIIAVALDMFVRNRKSKN